MSDRSRGDRGPLVSPGARVVLGVSLKMYFGYRETLDWCTEVARLARGHRGIRDGTVELFVLPSFPALPAVAEIFGTGPVAWGAQDLAWTDDGAFTGEVGGAMLRELGCRYAEIGHAERRRHLGEDDVVVAAKTAAAVRHGLVPVLCLGEPSRSDPERVAELCADQVRAALAGVPPSAPDRLVVAYEPHWAIGADRPADPGYVSEVCGRLGATVRGIAGGAARVIYGGTAGPGLLSRLGGDVDGLFLGRSVHDARAMRGVLDEAHALASAGHASTTRLPGGARTSLTGEQGEDR